ncbi:hypothetical protein [Falsiroseomonas sp.]|uniref:hypothetical protein n=1 Tax=Falsiroseomonas sp. TaxID=2870721 RepID=UPI002732FB74|nr:hypothetical protein [Falsiroseomonas sp.]MDP3417404.1 hypothetical protein [Falsiroseomonas sp.]
MRVALLALLLLSACGGRAAPEGPPRDGVLDRAAGSARDALNQDQPVVAGRLYAQALARARERDDPVAIDAMGFGQATSALARGDAPAALAAAQEVRAELARRGRGASAGLLLAEATALFRLGRMTEADRLARFVASRGAENAEAALRAHFLLGLLAAGRGDLAGVVAARAAIGAPEQAAYRADAVELEGAAALLRGDAAGARVHAATAADLRRDSLDYRGLSRALALQGAALERLGDPAAAADAYLRAGRGAAERGEADAARWLGQARQLAGGRADLLAAIRQAEALRER